MQELVYPTMPVDVMPKLDYAGIRAYRHSGSNVIYCTGRTAPMDGGQGTLILDSADTTSTDDDGSVLVDAIGRRWKRADPWLDLGWFGAVPGGNIAAAWDKAVAVVDSYVRTYGFDDRKAIYLKRGTYYTNRVLDIPSYVSVVGIGGNVNIRAQAVPRDSFIIRITNKVAGVDTTHHSGWNLGCIGGTFKVQGEGYLEGSSGIYVGVSASNMSQVRNVFLYSVATEDVWRGLTLGSVNTYLLTLEKCQLEGADVALYIPNSTSTNSGERMVFNNSTFAGSKTNHVHVATPGMDLTFNSCSFDFTNGNVIYGTATWGYSKIALNNCRTEGYDLNLLKVEPPQGGSIGTNRSVIISSLVNLPRNRSGSTAYNSPSKLKIDAASTPVYISGLDQRTEKAPYTEDIVLASDSTRLFLSGYLKDAFFHIPSTRYILNRGYNMSEEVIGTVVNSPSTLGALTNFNCVNRNAMSVEVVARGSDKQLQVTGAGGFFQFTTKAALPVPADGRVGMTMAVSAASSTGTINCAMSCEWLDASGVVLSTYTGFARNMRTIFNDSSMPNYSEGNARYISTDVDVGTAPAGAVSFRPIWLLSGFTGIVYVSRIIACRMAG